MTRADELFKELQINFSEDKHKEFSKALASELNNKETKPTQERKTELFEMAAIILEKVPRHKPKSDEGVRKDEGFESYDPNANRYHMIGGKIKEKLRENLLKSVEKLTREDLLKRREDLRKYNANM